MARRVIAASTGHANKSINVSGYLLASKSIILCSGSPARFQLSVLIGKPPIATVCKQCSMILVFQQSFYAESFAAQDVVLALGQNMACGIVDLCCNVYMRNSNTSVQTTCWTRTSRAWVSPHIQVVFCQGSIEPEQALWPVYTMTRNPCDQPCAVK